MLLVRLGLGSIALAAALTAVLVGILAALVLAGSLALLRRLAG